MKTEADKNNAKKTVEEYSPCAKKLLINIILTLSVCVGVIYFGHRFESVEGYAMIGLTLFISMQAAKIGEIIIRMFRYRSAKKKLSKYTNETENN